MMNSKIEDEDLINEDKMEADDDLRFSEARDGDHLMTTFQCDECHFENCKRRSPISGNNEDELAMVCIRRAILDAFWSRERTTIASNKREGMMYVSGSDQLGWDDPYPQRGPFQVSDDCGMKIACSILLRSLAQGKNDKTIQYSTMRRMRGHLSNYVHTVPGGIGPTFVSSDNSVSSISQSPTNSEWFRRFMNGCHKRMGDVWIPDRAITMREFKAGFQLLERDWEVETKDDHRRMKTTMTAIILIAGFFGALRGEEIVRIDIGKIREHWVESVNHEYRHVPMMLSGRFKREVGEKSFCQPLAWKSKSGIEIGRWFHRALTCLEKVGIIFGPMFRVSSSQNRFRRASMGDVEVLFLDILKDVQGKFPSIIADTVDIAGEYSVSRSLRRGVTAEAQNVRIPKEVIESNNRWRKHCRSKGLTPGMSMMERYTDAKASVPALIRFSESL